MSTQDTPVSISAVQTTRPRTQEGIASRFLNRKALGTAFTYFIGILLSLWILLPILFIASMALTTQEVVRSYPKGVLPFIPFSSDTLTFFLESRGVIPGILNSVLVAAITLVLSTVIAAPAGYALSRFFFPGR